MPLGGSRLRRAGQQEPQANPMQFRERLQRADAINSPNVNQHAVQQPAQQPQQQDFMSGMASFYAGIGKGIMRKVQSGAQSGQAHVQAQNTPTSRYHAEEREQLVVVDD